MAKRKPKPADKPEESKPKDRAERPRGGREGGGHFATITEPNGERHAVYIKGPRPADMKRGGMPESVRRHVMKRHGSAVRAKQGGFRERVEAAKAAKAKPPLPSLVRAKSRPPEVVAGRKEVAGRLRTAYREGRSYVTSSPDYHRNSPALQGGAALPTGRSYRRDVKEGIEKSKSNFMRTSAANPRVADSKQIEIREQAAGNAGTRKGLREIFRTGTVASKPAGPSLREQAAAARAKKGTPEVRAKDAALARSMRSTIASPPPIRGVSAKQEAYAADVRRTNLEHMRPVRLPHEPASTRAQRFTSLAKRAEVAKLSDARQVIDRLGGPKPPNSKSQMIQQARRERQGMSPEDIRAIEATEKRIPARTPTPARPSLREQAAAARAKKGTPQERVAALRGRVEPRVKAASDELRRVDNAKNRHDGPWDKYQRLIERGKKAETTATRVSGQAKRVSRLERAYTPEKFGIVRGSERRKQLADKIREARSQVAGIGKKIVDVNRDPNAEAVHSLGLWGEIGQNRGRSRRAKDRLMAKYDRQASQTVALDKTRQAARATLASLRSQARSLRPATRKSS